MEIVLKRIAKRDTYTIGHLYIDGVFVCDTLEDTDRGLNSSMPLSTLKNKKIKGKTAIPYGTYTVLTNIKSPRLSQKAFYIANANNGRVPRLDGVPMYDGVLIHCGNTDADTEGCILVGENKVKGKLINSQTTFKKLYPIIANAKGKVTITIQ